MIARVAAAALPVATVTLAVAALAVLTAWLRWVPPIAGFAAFALALVGGGGVSLLLGVLSVFVSGSSEHGSRAAGALAAAVGLGCIIALVVLASGARGAPPIHDISTDTADPPRFEAALASPANAGRDLDYPNGSRDTPRLQAQAYSDVVPIKISRTADEAFQEALFVARELGWSIVDSDAAGRTFEAEAETSLFRFVDDIAVRIRPDGAGALVDVRSTSRVGVSDMGVNAERIRRFRDLLTAR